MSCERSRNIDDRSRKPIRTRADMKSAIDEIDVEVSMMLLDHPNWVVAQWQEKAAGG